MTPAAIASTVSSVVPLLTPIVTAIEGAAGVSPSTVTQVQAAMEGVQGGAAALAQSDSIAAQMPIAQRIETDATAVLTVAASLPLPPPAALGLRIAAFAVPSLFNIVNAIVAAQRAPAPAAKAA